MKKIESKEVTLYSDYSATESYPYEDYVEWCEAIDVEPAEENSEDYYDWANEQVRNDFKDLEMNIKYSKMSDYPCLIVGSFGLWDGRHQMSPKYCKDLGEAIEKTCYANFDHYTKVEIEKDSSIKVSQSHHDGTNTFYIIILTKKGENRWNSLYENDKEEDFDTWREDYRRKFEYLY